MSLEIRNFENESYEVTRGADGTILSIALLKPKGHHVYIMMAAVIAVVIAILYDRVKDWIDIFNGAKSISQGQTASGLRVMFGLTKANLIRFLVIVGSLSVLAASSAIAQKYADREPVDPVTFSTLSTQFYLEH